MIVIEPAYVSEHPNPTGEPPRGPRPLGWRDAALALGVLFLLYALSTRAAAWFLSVPLVPPDSLPGARNPTVVLLGSALGQGLMVLYLCARVYVRMRRDARAYLGLVADLPPIALLSAPVLAFGALSLAVVLVPLASRFGPPEHVPIVDLMQRATPADLAWYGVFGITLAPFCEELIFRGFLFPIARRYLSVGAAVAVVALSFLGLHVVQTGGYWISMVMIGTLAVILTWQRAAFGSMLPSWITHTCYNLALILAMAAALAADHAFTIFYYVRSFRALVPPEWRG